MSLSSPSFIMTAYYSIIMMLLIVVQTSILSSFAFSFTIRSRVQSVRGRGWKDVDYTTTTPASTTNHLLQTNAILKHRFAATTTATAIRTQSFQTRIPTMLYQSMETEDDATTDATTASQGGMSDLDARVLQSLLEDKSLDLKSEENLMKMLENRQRNKDSGNSGRSSSSSRSAGKEEDLNPYSSTFFKVRKLY